MSRAASIAVLAVSAALAGGGVLAQNVCSAYNCADGRFIGHVPSGVLKGSGGALTPASPGTDYYSQANPIPPTALQALLSQGTGTVPQTLAQLFGTRLAANTYAGLDPTGATDSSAAINNMISDAASTPLGTAGRSAFLPYGTYKIASPIIVKTGVHLYGECQSNPHPTGQPVLSCTRIVPGANMTAMITQAGVGTSVLLSVALDHLTIDAAQTTYTLSDVIYISIENSTLEYLQVAGSSSTGNCVSLAPVPGVPTWLNTINNNTFGGCTTGYGLYAGLSDSRITGNYISGNSTDLYIVQGGNSVVANEIDNSWASAGITGGTGLVEVPDSVCQVTNSIVANDFNQNGSGGDIHIQAGSCGPAIVKGTIVGNVFNNSDGPFVNIDNNVVNGLITGNAFASHSSGSVAKDVAFAGTVNTGWTVSPNTHNNAPQYRFSNLPLDATVDSNGGGGVYNQRANQTLQLLTATPAPPAAGLVTQYISKNGSTCQISAMNSAGTVSAIGASFPCN